MHVNPIFGASSHFTVNELVKVVDKDICRRHSHRVVGEREHIRHAGNAHQFKVLKRTSIHVGMRIKHDCTKAVLDLMYCADAFASLVISLTNVAVRGVKWLTYDGRPIVISVGSKQHG